VSRQRSSCI